MELNVELSKKRKLHGRNDGGVILKTGLRITGGMMVTRGGVDKTDKIPEVTSVRQIKHKSLKGSQNIDQLTNKFGRSQISCNS